MWASCRKRRVLSRNPRIAVRAAPVRRRMPCPAIAFIPIWLSGSRLLSFGARAPGSPESLGDNYAGGYSSLITMQCRPPALARHTIHPHLTLSPVPPLQRLIATNVDGKPQLPPVFYTGKAAVSILRHWWLRFPFGGSVTARRLVSLIVRVTKNASPFVAAWLLTCRRPPSDDRTFRATL